MSVVAIDATIGDRTLRTLKYNYSSDTGRINRIQVRFTSLPYLRHFVYLLVCFAGVHQLVA